MSTAWCYVSQVNSVVLEVEVDAKANGQECLDKVCEQVGIIEGEADYFGLQYRGSKGETLWLNLRNRIDQQLSSPYRFQLRVKFFVQPHMLLHDATKNQFYHHIRQDITTQNATQKIIIPDEDVPKICAIIAQAEHGDYCNNANQKIIYLKILQCIAEPLDNIVENIAHEHRTLQGVKKSTAKYLLIHEVSVLKNFGVEYHSARTELGEYLIGIGPNGIHIYDSSNVLIEKIEYPMIQMAKHDGRSMILNVIDDRGECRPHSFKLISQKAAIALYRCITEMHSFFRCDTVQNEVSTQYFRDLKGTIASYFNEKTSLGKMYVFDIRRTSREAYDHARRVLYSNGYDSNTIHFNESASAEARNNKNSESCDNDYYQECLSLREKLESIQDIFLCIVCMDSEISTALCPCGHVICCDNCASRFDLCPLCRTQIGHVQKIFFQSHEH